jgi:hypothetical protein
MSRTVSGSGGEMTAKDGLTGPMPPRPSVITLAVIPEPKPDTRTVIEGTDENMTLLVGDGPGPTMVCGNCGKTLVIGMTVRRVRNLVFKCPKCGEYNETLS